MLGVAHSYLRFPHVHGELITFVAEDDVWLAPISGGRAWRVSADHVPATRPRFSPDGSRLAWTSLRDVDPEVHVADVNGGQSRRLTYWGDVRTVVLGWYGVDEVLVASSVDESSFRRAWAFSVPTDGGPATRLPYGPVGDLAIAEGGVALLSSTMSREPAWWKRYRGGTAGKLWLDVEGSGEFTRILSDVEGNFASPVWFSGRVGFCADHEGIGAVYSCERDGSDLRRHSYGEFYARHASGDGSRVVYESAGALWLLDGLDAEPRRLEISLGGPRADRQPYPVSPGRNLRDALPDRTGRASVVEVRGTVHWLTHREGPARVLAAEAGVRARYPRVLGETGKVAFVTDADGEDAIEIAPTSTRQPGAAPHRIGCGQLGRVLELVAAPDGRQLAATSHDGRLSVIDTETGEIREVTRSDISEPTSPAFSPDSRWLAWSHPGPDPLSNIRMVNTTDLSTMDVTDLRFDDTEPVFTLDGKHLAFLSQRTFDPIYDAHVFDLSFPAACRPYLVPLGALTPSPFDPRSEGRPVGDDDSSDGTDSSTESGTESGKDRKDGDGKSGGDSPPRTLVDIEGLTERVTPLPVDAGSYSSLRAVRGGLMWLRSQPSGVLGDSAATADTERSGPRLERFEFTKRRAETVLDEASSVEVSGDGKRVVVSVDDGLRVLPADRKYSNGDHDHPDDDTEIDLSRIRVSVDPAAEWAQEYDEAGRLMRDHFWRADMGGVDWAATLAKYRPLIEAVGTHNDLVDLLWEVQGELGTSHAYVTPSGGYRDRRRQLGLLGADLRRDEDGTWRVVRVLPSDTSLPEARSPLAAPGVAVRAGDAVLAVDGRPVDPLSGPAPLLVGTVGKPVELTIGPADGHPVRQVVVVPLLDDKPLRYQAWVANRREYVHQQSDGRVGYLHVPDMVATGWAQLHRDLHLEVRRDALVVDIRENRGGHLSQLVVEKLARKVVGWQTGRDGYRAETYPVDAPRGPVVAVANEFSGSDGDIVNAVIKAMGIGPVVGTRTWGGTIGIDMRYRLVDGTLVTQPRYATWLSGLGWGVENHGVDPDVEVVMAPQDWAAGRDPQLDEGIRIALRSLAEHPAARLPDIPPLPGF